MYSYPIAEAGSLSSFNLSIPTNIETNTAVNLVKNRLFTIGGEGINIILRLVIILIFSIFYISKNNNINNSK